MADSLDVEIKLLWTATPFESTASTLTCSQIVELRGIEPLTYSMRTSRATNCAIAPGAGSRLPAAASPPKILLAGCSRQVNVACERGVVEVFEERVLIVDLEHH